MPFVAMANAVPGGLASSSEYNKVVANANQLNTTRTKYKVARCTSNTVVTTSAADVAGANVSFTTAEANTEVLIVGHYDVELTNGSDIFIGTMSVDGAAAQSPEAHLSATGRATISQAWLVTVATAGVHTAKLRVAKANNLGTVTCYATHSSVLVEGQGVT